MNLNIQAILQENLTQSANLVRRSIASRTCNVESPRRVVPVQPPARYVLKSNGGDYLTVKTECRNTQYANSYQTIFIWTDDIEQADIYTSADMYSQYLNQLPPGSVRAVRVQRAEV